MQFNILKNKKIKKGLLLFLGLLTPNIVNCVDSYAEKAVPYYTDGGYDGFIDTEIPPAIRLTQWVDNLPTGTILYRKQYLDFTYYTPVTPSEFQGTSKEVNPTWMRQWGPWDIPANQNAYQESVAGSVVPGFIPSSYTYDKVYISAGTTIYGTKVNSKGVEYTTSLGTLSSSYYGTPKSVSNYKTSSDPYIYFDLSGTNLSGKGVVNIGRVQLYSSSVSVGNKIDLYYPDSRAIYDRFAKYGVYSDSAGNKTIALTDASHQNIEWGKWVNPWYAPYDLAGKSGEWYIIGYNADGDTVGNPYFINTGLQFRGNAPLRDYDFRYTPWNPYDSDGKTESNKTTASNNFPSLTKYDTNSKYYDAKYVLMEKLFNNGVFYRTKGSLYEDVIDMMNRTSFRTSPENEATFMVVQRRGSTSRRSFTAFNELSDIYMSCIRVYNSWGQEVAWYYYDINSGGITRHDAWGIYPGQQYTVKVRLGNSKNKNIIASKNQVQIGLVSNYRDYNSLPISWTSNTQSREEWNTIGNWRSAQSQEITFNITAPDADFFDIYSYVGYKHLGTDNLDESNDVGRVRLNIRGTDYGEQYESTYADLVAHKIEILDIYGNVLYSYTRDHGGPSIYNAVSPGQNYQIRYTVVNQGDDAKYRVKSRGYWSGDRWIPGSWGGWIYNDTYLNVWFNYSRINSSNSWERVPSTQKTTVSNGLNIWSGGSNIFKVYRGSQFTCTINDVDIEHPFLETAFSVDTNGHANSNNWNDYLSTTISPQYDASVNNVQIFPINEYTLSGGKNISFLVTYDAYLSAPSFMHSGGTGMEVETSVSVGGKTQVFYDTLAFGENKNISHTLKDVYVNGGSSVYSTVTLNYNSHTYETNYGNNRAYSSYSYVHTVNNPFNGNNTDTVKWVDTSNNGQSSVGGGSLNNNCLIPRRRQEWGVNHTRLNWMVEYRHSNINGNGIDYKKYRITGKNDVGWYNYYETFNISSILYRSKDTKDKKLGNDGWIELTDASQKDLATIKAGYGFELKVVAEYRTNVLKNMPTNVDEGWHGSYYTNVTDNPTISLPSDVFVELPGSNSSRIILSSTGYAGTTKGLNVEERDVSNAWETIKQLTYTIKTTNSLGIKDSNKIFTPDTLKNGDYKVSIYSTPVSGIPSINKGTYSSMCDRRDVYVKINGAYTDDLNSHTLQ